MERMEENRALPFGSVTVADDFWAERQGLVTREMIPYQWKALNDALEDTEPSGSIRNFRIAAGLEQGEFYGCVFQDSDVAKWIESVAYSLWNSPDAELEKTVDNLIDVIGMAQQPDGYLNTYYIINGLEHRFTNLMYHHELYCCGHFIEAAVAYEKVTGKRKLLDIICRYVDCIAANIGPEPGKLHGYPGHEIIEMALVKLYDATGERKYLDLAAYFIHVRGTFPSYFEAEIAGRGGEFKWKESPFGLQYYQAGIPVTEQAKAEGHAVRAVYLYSGMADVARLTGDMELRKGCERLFRDIAERQMYVTGSIGASAYGESFTDDYLLPNDTMYGETCAAIGLVFFAYRMLKLENRREYADVMERVLYNGAISGMSMDGKKFFYVNPLEVVPAACKRDWKYNHVKTRRQKWFKCACCPPNLARMVESIGEYVYTVGDNRLNMHLYMSNRARMQLGDCRVEIAVETGYPWNGEIRVRMTEADAPFDLAMRIPEWCAAWTAERNGRAETPETEKGYALFRACGKGDEILLRLDMQVRFMRAHPSVRADAGKVAMTRGPIVYCLEEEDNGPRLWNVLVDPATSWRPVREDGLGGLLRVEGEGFRETVETDGDTLYRPAETKLETVPLKWIPYYAWANRSEGEMRVWIRRL